LENLLVIILPLLNLPGALSALGIFLFPEFVERIRFRHR